MGANAAALAVRAAATGVRVELAGQAVWVREGAAAAANAAAEMRQAAMRAEDS